MIPIDFSCELDTFHRENNSFHSIHQTKDPSFVSNESSETFMKRDILLLGEEHSSSSLANRILFYEDWEISAWCDDHTSRKMNGMTSHSHDWYKSREFNEVFTKREFHSIEKEGWK